MKIAEVLADATRPHFSFEFFPPKTPKGEKSLFTAVGELKALRPDYVSVTYGAGGSTRKNTVKWVDRIKNEMGLEAMAHLTCLGNSRFEIRQTLTELEKAGIENVLALRGDCPADLSRQDSRLLNPDFPHATDLIKYIHENHSFSLGGAVYPEVHPEATSPEDDLKFARLKQDNGAGFLITQLFFIVENYIEFEKKARAAGITVPIIPGIMPITNYGQIAKFSQMCGAIIPPEIHEQMKAIESDPDKVLELGIEIAVDQCRRLLEYGVPGFHFYTLNRSQATMVIFERLKKFL